MRRTTVLLQMLHPSQDADYVERFQALAAVNLELRRQGANASRLLQKAALEIDVGNHASALAAARHAIQLAPRDAEPHFVAARALMLMALVRARVLPGATGSPGDAAHTREAPRESARQLSAEAVGELHAALRLNAEDDEALEDAALIDAMLAAHPEDAAFARALRTQADAL